MPRTVKPRTKRRGYRQDGRKLDGEAPSLDLCPCCLSFRCDPMSMSESFRNKIRERRRTGLCPTCGRPEGFCRSGSSVSAERVGKAIPHDNRKLRRARALVEARGRAYRAWKRQEDVLVALMGEDPYAAVLDALYHHKAPSADFGGVSRVMQAAGLDANILEPAWTGKA